MQQFLLIVTLAICWSSANAEVYKCGETWSSKPCADPTTAPANLRELSRVGTSQTPSAPSTPEPATTQSKEKVLEECEPAGDGDNFQLQTLTARTNIAGTFKRTMLSGVVRNLSTTPITSPVRIRVRKLGSQEASYFDVAQNIAAGNSAPFSFELISGGPNEPHRGRYEVLALTTKQRSCESSIVNLDNSAKSTVDETGSTMLKRDSTGRAESDAKEELRRLESQLKELERQSLFANGKGSEMNRQAIVHLQRIETFCKTGAPVEGQSSFASACFDLIRRAKRFVGKSAKY